MMSPVLLLVMAGVFAPCLGSYYQPKQDQCYRYEDHSAKYRLSHNKGSDYPTTEINLVLLEHPEMKEMFYPANDNLKAVLPKPQPMASVCPYSRYTLYSFFYDTEHCYVIYPEVQRINYVHCSSEYNHNCQQCTYHGGVSKCDEDYEYRQVWAYCTNEVSSVPPRSSLSQPSYPAVYDNINQRTDPSRLPSATRYGSPLASQAQPISPPRNAYPSRQIQRRYPIPTVYKDPWNKLYRPHVLQSRWRRSSHLPKPKGRLERKALYLPHHCGCKTYVC